GPANLASFLGIVEPGKEVLGGPLAEDGWDQVGSQTGAAGRVGILIRSDDLSLLPRSLDETKRIGCLAPCAPAIGFQVRNVDGQLRLAADGQRLINGDQEAGSLIAHV